MAVDDVAKALMALEDDEIRARIGSGDLSAAGALDLTDEEVGLVREAAARGDNEPHPGRERKYYALTTSGRTTLGAEARRLNAVAALAERRLRTADSR